MCDRCWKQTHLPTAGMLSKTDTTSDVHHTNSQQLSGEHFTQNALNQVDL